MSKKINKAFTGKAINGIPSITFKTKTHTEPKPEIRGMPSPSTKPSPKPDTTPTIKPK